MQTRSLAPSRPEKQSVILPLLVLSQMQSSVVKSAADFQPRLRGDSQGLIDESDLADYISLSQPPDLTFSDHVHRLISTDRVLPHQSPNETRG